MARFDVMALSDGSLLLDCQSDLLSGLGTRFVVPLVCVDDAPSSTIARLNPHFEVEGQEVVMLTQYSGAVSNSAIGRCITSLADESDRIMNAIDMLLTGY